MGRRWKKGLYLGSELPDEHPRVKAGVPLHGANLIPSDAVLPDFRRAVLEYIDQVTRLGIACSKRLPGHEGDAEQIAARIGSLIWANRFVENARNSPLLLRFSSRASSQIKARCNASLCSTSPQALRRIILPLVTPATRPIR